MALSPNFIRLYLPAVIIVALAVVSFWKTSGQRSRPLVAVVRRPSAVMGTSCTLIAVVKHEMGAQAEKALSAAESELRGVEALMSTWLDNSEISRLNRAKAMEEVTISSPTLEVIHMSMRATRDTHGAFDPTCRPLIELWRAAAKKGLVPSDARVNDAREASSWRLFKTGDRWIMKVSDTACLDLGGIAKGYAIDRARRAMEGFGLSGGLVDVGGDLICFGTPVPGECWVVELRDPFGPGILGRLRIKHGAVCTSGNYARFSEIQGRRYSHIIDPRSGLPTDAIPSVTVVARDAVTADVWATALSVLGEEGFAHLPLGVDAMLVIGAKDNWRLALTGGMRNYLDRDLRLILPQHAQQQDLHRQQ